MQNVLNEIFSYNFINFLLLLRSFPAPVHFFLYLLEKVSEAQSPNQSRDSCVNTAFQSSQCWAKPRLSFFDWKEFQLPSSSVLSLVARQRRLKVQVPLQKPIIFERVYVFHPWSLFGFPQLCWALISSLVKACTNVPLALWFHSFLRSQKSFLFLTIT